MGEQTNVAPTPNEGMQQNEGNAQPNVPQEGQAGNIPAPSTPQPLEFEIEGMGKVTADQIKEYKMGYMRQSDYTRKTQEVSKQREEAKEAMEIYNYLRSNPQIAQALADGDANLIATDPKLRNLVLSNPELDDMRMELANIKLDSEINRLKREYPDFDEVMVLEEADKRGLQDLEFVYNALKGKQTDMNTLKQQIEKEIRTKLTEEIRKNGIITETIAQSGDIQPTNVNYGLSEAEVRIAAKMGLTPEQYAKGKN